MESIWQKDIQLPSYPKLNGDISTDVLIIGGWINVNKVDKKMRSKI